MTFYTLPMIVTVPFYTLDTVMPECVAVLALSKRADPTQPGEAREIAVAGECRQAVFDSHCRQMGIVDQVRALGWSR